MSDRFEDQYSEMKDEILRLTKENAELRAELAVATEAQEEHIRMRAYWQGEAHKADAKLKAAQAEVERLRREEAITVHDLMDAQKEIVECDLLIGKLTDALNRIQAWDEHPVEWDEKKKIFYYRSMADEVLRFIRLSSGSKLWEAFEKGMASLKWADSCMNALGIGTVVGIPTNDVKNYLNGRAGMSEALALMNAAKEGK